MLLERIEVPGLSHYSYSIACPADGRMIVVDPERNIGRYLDFAAKKRFTISHVLETHIHADYASGARELAQKTGAELGASAHDEGETFEVQFPHRDLREGDAIEIGSVRVEPLHTPGHTPEHLSFLVYDLKRSDDTPMAMLSGDFLFVGSLGRPDLLGEEQKRGLAHAMFRSVREKLAGLPDGLEIHPAHGAGSMCGAGMSGRPFSTLGFERVANPYLDPSLSEDEFVERLLTDVPPFPPYYRRMKTVNSEGPRILEGVPGDEAIDAATFRGLVEQGHVVIDLRDHAAFNGAHIPDSFGIGLKAALPVWAAWVVPYDTPILLVADSAKEAREASRMLVRVGLDDVRGYLEGGFETWRRAGYPMSEIGQIDVCDLEDALRDGAELKVLDVRTDREWRQGHIEGARHVHGGLLGEHPEKVPPEEGPFAVVCGSGYRSTVAASVLQRAGLETIYNVPGGMTAWKRAGLPTVAGEPVGKA